MLKQRVRKMRKQVEPCRREDPDGIHDLRVATRRIRATISAHKSLLGKDPRKAFLQRIRQVTRGLGKARELDVTIDLLEEDRKRLKGLPRHAASHAIRRLRTLRAAESAEITGNAARMEDQGFDALLMAVFESLRATRKCYLDHAEAVLNKQLGALRRLNGEWQKSGCEENLHQLRIGYKKLRYTCETFVPLYGAKMKRLISELKDAQEWLGRWNDYRVARDYVLGMSGAAPPRAAEGVGALSEYLHGEAENRLARYREEAVTFFASGHMRRLKELFSSPTRPCCRKRPKKK
jgi:CHAD domain-containing protein